jgi:putative endonuclease
LADTLTPRANRLLRPAARIDRQAIGRAAEEVASDYYWAAGYALLGRNVRLGRLEVDLVVRQGPLVIVVEVRTRGRGSRLSAFASVNGPKLRRLKLASQRLWLRLRGDRSIERIRVDVAAVDLSSTPVTIEIARAVC